MNGDIIVPRKRKHIWYEHLRDGFFVGGITVEGPYISGEKWYVLVRRPGEIRTRARVIEYQTYLMNIALGERTDFKRVYTKAPVKMCACGERKVSGTNGPRSACGKCLYQKRYLNEWLHSRNVFNERGRHG